MPYCHWSGDSLICKVRIQTRASKDEIVGPHGDRLRIRITAPPVDGRANAHLIAFIAKTFGVAKRQVVIVRGLTSREKDLQIESPKKLPASINLSDP